MDILRELDAFALTTVQCWQRKVEPCLVDRGFLVRHLKPRHHAGLGCTTGSSLRTGQSRLVANLGYLVHFHRRVRQVGTTDVEAYLQVVLHSGDTKLASKCQGLYLGALPLDLPLWTRKLSVLTSDDGLLSPVALASTVDYHLRP